MNNETIRPGSVITFRELQRLHPQHQGIYTKHGIAVSILFSMTKGSPYPDKWVRKDSLLEYTGQGDFRKSDQAWNRYNIGMRRAMEENRRIHVSEKLEGHPVRYLYHGEWSIEGFREVIFQATGKKVFRFLIGSDLDENANLASSAPMLAPHEIGSDAEEPATRFLALTHRIIRDTRICQRLKKVYSFKCQICGVARQTGQGHFYAEAHHIKPLGRPHNGPDTADNIVVLCPNHHADFDLGAIAIDPLDGLTVLHPFDRSVNGKKVKFIRNHHARGTYINYHFNTIFEARRLQSPNA